MTTQVTRISLEISDVFDGWRGDMDGINQKASNYAYCGALEKRLQELYPDAEVTVASRPNQTGGGHTNVTAEPEDEDDLLACSQAEDGVRFEISNISDNLFNGSESWLVIEACA